MGAVAGDGEGKDGGERGFGGGAVGGGEALLDDAADDARHVGKLLHFLREWQER